MVDEKSKRDAQWEVMSMALAIAINQFQVEGIPRSEVAAALYATAALQAQGDPGWEAGTRDLIAMLALALVERRGIEQHIVAADLIGTGAGMLAQAVGVKAACGYLIKIGEQLIECPPPRGESD